MIKGEKFTETGTEQQIEVFIKQSLNIEVKVNKAYIIKRNREDIAGKTAIATIQNWEMKKEVMKKKSELKKGIYIDDDLTVKQREIQMKIRKIAKQEKEKGKETKIGYMKIKIDGKWMKWDEHAQKFQEETREQDKEEERKIQLTNSGLKLCVWNVAGVVNKDKEFWEYISDFDVVGLIETWLEEKNWQKIKNKLPKTLNWKYCCATMKKVEQKVVF